MSERILITGAACRIGRAIALHLAGQGADIIVHYHHSAREAAELLSLLPAGGHSSVACDLSDMTQVQALLPRLCAEGRKPTALVNNASVYLRGGLGDSDPEQTLRCMQVNFLAPFELMRQFRVCIGKGNIVNLTDQRNCYADPQSGIYGIAKKALQDASEAAALEWAPEIRVNMVAPGIVLPPPGKSWERMQPLLERIPMKERTTEEQVAQAMAFLLNTPCLTGQTIYTDGGMHVAARNIESK